MDTVPVWVNLLNPVRRLTNSADCNQHRTRLYANGRFWRKVAVHTQAASRFPGLNLPRARAECSATKLDFAAGDSERALQGAAFRARDLIEQSLELGNVAVNRLLEGSEDSGSKLDKKSASGSHEKLPRSPQILRQR
jgi:hypothetical protein